MSLASIFECSQRAILEPGLVDLGQWIQIPLQLMPFCVWISSMSATGQTVIGTVVALGVILGPNPHWRQPQMNVGGFRLEPGCSWKCFLPNCFVGGCPGFGVAQPASHRCQTVWVGRKSWSSTDGRGIESRLVVSSDSFKLFHDLRFFDEVVFKTWKFCCQVFDQALEGLGREKLEPEVMVSSKHLKPWNLEVKMGLFDFPELCQHGFLWVQYFRDSRVLEGAFLQLSLEELSVERAPEPGTISTLMSVLEAKKARRVNAKKNSEPVDRTN